MSETGIAHPNKLDLVTRGADGFHLVVVEDRALTEDDVPALRVKLANYLGFAIDGDLLEQYSEAQGQMVSIRMDFYAQPAPFILQLTRNYRTAIAKYGISLEIDVNGEVVS
jgi:hypothetical protein